MRMSRKSAVLLRVGVGITLAFIYIPLVVIALYAFNSSDILQWPPPSLTTRWFSEAFHNTAARDALVADLSD